MTSNAYNAEELKKLLIASLQGDRASYRLFLTQLTPLIERIAHKAFHKDDVPDITQDI